MSPLINISLALLLAGLVLAAELPVAARDVVAVAHIDSEPLAYFDRLRALAIARGIPGEIAAGALGTLLPDNTVLARIGNQAEHARTPGDYVGALVSAERIANGRARLADLAEPLGRIERTWGVDRHILVAIWGIESGYGERQGEHAIIRSLATLAEHDGRRQLFWTDELIAALRILAGGDVPPDRMLGSWAGAMGHVQLMPSSYLARAVDFDGDGRRDIWTTPADALASAASFLQAAGWSAAGAWGSEVQLPPGFDPAEASPSRGRPLAAWQALGIGAAAGALLPDLRGALQLLLPQGIRGPAFLVGANFDALLRYNNAMSYALAVGHLADRLRGAPVLATPWPSEPALTLSQRIELQRRLGEHGHDPGGLDGILGHRTREAVRAYQRHHGLPADGHPGAGLLERMAAGNVP